MYLKEKLNTHSINPNGMTNVVHFLQPDLQLRDHGSDVGATDKSTQ